MTEHTPGPWKQEAYANARLIADLLAALEGAIEAIESLPPDALGMVQSNDGCYEWPIRDELIDHLKSVAAEARDSGE